MPSFGPPTYLVVENLDMAPADVGARPRPAAAAAARRPPRPGRGAAPRAPARPRRVGADAGRPLDLLQDFREKKVVNWSKNPPSSFGVSFRLDEASLYSVQRAFE